MANSRRGLVDTVKQAVARVGTRGALSLVEGTAAAVRTVDRLQAKLTRQLIRGGGRVPSQAKRRVVRKTRVTAEAAPRRAKAPMAKRKAPKPGFKVKRGQKHRHSGR
ncbi:hypothetical protein P2318_34090 [Myxococcaceae bacterium GXIMD 01537]